MICHNLSEILGFTCHPLNEDGSVAFVESSFEFHGGNMLPIYLKTVGHSIMFFDDHETVYNYIKRGYRECGERLDTTLIKSAISPFNLDFSDNQISVIGSAHDAKKIFARYFSGLLAASDLNKPAEPVDSKLQKLVGEVAELLPLWRPGATLKTRPEYKGLSKTKYKLDFQLDGEAVIVATPNANSVGSALRKMVDIAGRNPSIEFRVVLEDVPKNKKQVDSQSTILSTMATVMTLTRLKKEAENAREMMH